jgi:hypothetical protein
MFNKNLVVALKINGKTLRENGDTIELPFDSEYSIYLKNLHTSKALVSISIDGQDVLSGSKIIIGANSSLELDGFLDGNLVENKFRFIERTKQIEDFLGIEPEDGILQVIYQFEHQTNWNLSYTYYPANIWWGTYPSSYDYTPNTTTVYSGSGTRGRSNTSQTTNPSTDTVNAFHIQKDEGITVRGDDTEQHFYSGYIGTLENEKYSISFKLKGFKNESSQVIFTREKIECSRCGTKQKNNNKFCSQCGNRLQK